MFNLTVVLWRIFAVFLPVFCFSLAVQASESLEVYTQEKTEAKVQIKPPPQYQSQDQTKNRSILKPAGQVQSLKEAPPEAGFSGSTACQFCHQQQYKAWRGSHHYQSMLPAISKNVLGDFSGEELLFHQLPTRPYKKDGGFFFSTVDREGKPQDYKVLYTFGFFPLQQYIVDIGNGKLQVLNVAWDSRDDNKGGQRWFHLQPDENITTEHPFFWQGHFQNWNSRCAECHSTGLKKNHDPETLGYKTDYAEVNVACEACHGPAGEHVKLARQGRLPISKTNGFSHSPSDYSWQDMCAACHSRRTAITKPKPLSSFHDNYLLQTLEPGLYHADGRIQDEVFVTGSFLQSKMAGQGISCNNCHEPHSGKLVKEGDALCLQCHTDDLLEKNAVHIETDKLCVDCHMPETVYMQVDPRRDHGFHSPGKKALWAGINEKARRADPNVQAELAVEVNNNKLPGIIRATLFNQLVSFPSPLALDAINKGLDDVDPLVRRAAVNAMRFVPVDQSLVLLQKASADQDTGVAIAVARIVVDHWPGLSASQRENFAALLSRYKKALSYTEDTPQTQLEFAHMAMQQGDMNKAGQYFRRALQIEPSFVPALVNYADFLRRSGKDSQAQPLLEKALRVAPYSADVQHANGLYQVRQGDYKNALVYLEKAVRQQDATPRHVYVYAVALVELGERQKALAVLQSATEKWPGSFELGQLLKQLSGASAPR